MDGSSTGADLYKNSILYIISKMALFPWLFAVSKTAFSRTKSLSFGTMMRSVLSMQGGTIAKELSTLGIDVTTSGFVRRRGQILPEAFEFLYKEFTAIFPAPNRLKGYRIFAIDGSDIAAPANPDSPSYRPSGTIIKNGRTAKGCNLVHLNAMYDVLNKLYADAVITPTFTERDAAERMIRGYEGQKGIVIMDRGYMSYNMMETVNRNPDLDYVIRVMHGSTFKAVQDLPFEEFDVDRSVDITTVSTHHITGENVLLSGESTKGKDKKNVSWHYEREWQMDFRIVRFKINDSSDPARAYETIVTSLPREKFSLADIKSLYHLRWGIETSFRELKYNVGVVNFYSKKDSAVYQSIWAALTMYNFSMACAALAVVRQKPERKYFYAISIADAVAACMDFFTQVKIHAPPDGKALLKRIEKHVQPIRTGRADERKLYPKGAVYFMYRVAA